MTTEGAVRLGLWLRQVVLGRMVGASRPVLIGLATLWRRLLRRTTFIAVTGSVGKTTTTRLLSGILATRGRTFHTVGNQNSGVAVPLNVLRVRPWHRFAVIEVGVGEPDRMRRLARTLRPDMAIVLGVAPSHMSAFESLDHIAAEKATLLESLAVEGVVLLNGDDDRVARMSVPLRHPVRVFGTSPSFDLWADHLSSHWPARFSCHAHSMGVSVEIHTRLLGIHWAPAVMAALSAAAQLGIPLAAAAAALRDVEPYVARMEPVCLPNGAVVIRDDYGASVDSFEASLRFLREAQAERRVLVITDFSDSGLSRTARLKRLAAAASGWLELLIIVGEQQAYGVRRAIESGMSPQGVHGFPDLWTAAAFVRNEFRVGDLMLLKGRTTDHAARLLFAQYGTVTCRLDHCPKTMLCDSCWELGFQSDAGVRPASLGSVV